MWVASTFPFRGRQVATTTGHSDEEEALIAAHDRATHPRDLWAVYEITDEPVLPGWSQREERSA